MSRLLVVALLSAALLRTDAQIFGMGGSRRNHGMTDEEADHMRGTPQGAAAVDKAMHGWDELANNPEQMQEVLESFKDAEVMAKAKEMLNDPEYMRAAKKKLEEMTRSAQKNGFIDKHGQPVAGAATAAAKQSPATAALVQALMAQRSAQ